MMHLSSIAVAVLLFVVALPVTLAACEGANCTSCIEEFGCVWTVDGSCQEGCGDFPNIDCYFARIFRTTTAEKPATFTTEDICFAWANNVTENEACFKLTTAKDCLKLAGCDWKMGIIENGENRNWCALNLNYEPEALPCSATTCSECLADSSCTWWKGDKCTNSCDGRPNIECYDRNTFGGGSAAEICEVYSVNETMAANEACFNQTSKDGCFGESGCSWVAVSTEATTGHCTLQLTTSDATPADGSSGVERTAPSNLIFALSGHCLMTFVMVYLVGGCY